MPAGTIRAGRAGNEAKSTAWWNPGRSRFTTGAGCSRIGWPSTAPRRFRMRTARSPSQVSRARRSAAGEASPAARGGRNRKASACVPAAASCRRRSSGQVIFSGQASTAPQTVGAQRLLDCPQRLARGAGPDHDEPRQVYARSLQGRRVRQVGRRDPRQPAPARRQARERVTENAQFADSLVLRQDLGQRRGRPAAARELRVERGESRRQARRDDVPERAAAPDRGMIKDSTDR